MKAILFSGLCMMDRREIRESLIRIPEVLNKIRLAQKTIDQITNHSVELINCMSDDDLTYVSSGPIRRVLVNAVQVGLYERHIRTSPRPKFFVGSLNNLSAIEHCLGFSYTEELVRSLWYQDFNNESLQGSSLSIDKYQDIQTVHMLNKPIPYYIYELNQISEDMSESKKVEEADDPQKLISRLINKYEAKQIVNLGPMDLLVDPHHNPYHLEDIQIYNTIEADPMLGWFHTSLAM